MNRRRISSRSAFAWWELVAVIVVICVLIALLLPATERAREAARRSWCMNQLMQINVSLHNYHTAHKMFPPGVTCSAADITAESANPWADAKLTTKGASGTSWILCLLPYLEDEPIFKGWDFEFGVSAGTNSSVASLDIKGLYCPTRRAGLRPGIDAPMMLNPKWTGGGTDYGGCVGRHQGFLLDADQCVALPDAEDRLRLCFLPGVDRPNPGLWVPGDISGPNPTCDAKRGWGIFGRVNASTTLDDVKDGLSNTISIGELQRITQTTTTGPFNANSGPVNSHDGWAIGGSPTLFTTGYAYPTDVKTSPLMNNGHFMSPGSEHAGGVNFGLCDGSVRFTSTTIDPRVFALLGSMDDGVALPADEN